MNFQILDFRKGCSNLIELSEFTQEIDEDCPFHHKHLVQTYENIPFCPECEAKFYDVGKKDGVFGFYDLYDKGETNLSYHDFEKGINAVKYLAKESVFSDTTLRKATLENYRATSDEEKEALIFSKKIAKRFLNGESFNTIFTGHAGVGKSHLAMGIMKEVNQIPYFRTFKNCLFIGIGDALLEIRRSFNDKHAPYNENTMTDLLISADFLVLDDLGAESGNINVKQSASDYTQKFLYNVANGRQGKSTIITTNLSSAQLRTLYDEKLVSRLLSNATGNVLNFKGITDKRLVDF